MMAKKSPNPTDRYVGSRVRMRRMQLGHSQSWLGAKLGLTFQQVQKYEKGSNRIGASRLQQIADVLQVSPAWLFEGSPSTFEKGAIAPAMILSPSIVAEVVATRPGLDLVTAFHAISNVKTRQRIVALVEQIAEGESHGG